MNFDSDVFEEIIDKDVIRLLVYKFILDLVLILITFITSSVNDWIKNKRLLKLDKVTIEEKNTINIEQKYKDVIDMICENLDIDTESDENNYEKKLNAILKFSRNIYI